MAMSPPPACWRSGSTRPRSGPGSCSRPAGEASPEADAGRLLSQPGGAAGVTSDASCSRRETSMAKVVGVLCDDPIAGYPAARGRDDPSRIDCGADAHALRKYLEGNGHQLVVASDKDGPGSVFERELVYADIVISGPFWSAFLTAERIAKAPKLKLAITAGTASDHVDLQAAIDRGMTVAEIPCCNSISVAEHAVLAILALVRDYIPSYQWVLKGGWNIADCVARSCAVEGVHVGTVGAGRVGLAVLLRLRPFDVHLHYFDRYRLPVSIERELNLTWHPTVEDLVKVCDVVSISVPLHPETENLFDEK